MNAKLDNTNDKSEASLRLLMYTAMPARDSAWQAGFESARANIPIEDNPFICGEQEYECWENGWWAGFYEEDFLADDLLTELKAYHKEESRITKKYSNIPQNSPTNSINLKPKSNSVSSDQINKTPNQPNIYFQFLNWITSKLKFTKILIVMSILAATIISINLLILE